MRNTGVYLFFSGAMLWLFGALAAAVLETAGGRLLAAGAAAFFILFFVVCLPIVTRGRR